MALSRHCEALILLLATFILGIYKAEGNAVALPEILYFNVSVTERLEIFVKHNQRQYVAITKELEKELSEFKSNYDARLDTIYLNFELLDAKFNEVDHKLNPLELLDDVSDHCVQKYRPKLPVLNTLKTALTNCVTGVRNFYVNIVSTPTNTLNNLRNYYNSQFLNALKDCNTRFAKDEAKNKTCAQTAVLTTNGVTTTNLNNFKNQMKTAACTANGKIKEAFDCTSNVILPAYHTIGEVYALVDNCIAGHEFCPSADKSIETYKGRCPYQMGWHMSAQDLTVDTIKNPFKGLTKTTPCLQINFLTET